MSSAKKSTRDGFTLLELLVVVTVLILLLLISVSVFFKARERARQAATIADMRSLAVGIEAYQVDYGLPPAAESGFSEVARVLDPYHTTDVPENDHWEHLYDYRSSRVEYTLTSFGKDGVDGPDLTLDTRYDYDRDIVVVNGEFKSWPGDGESGPDFKEHPGQHLGHDGDGPPGQQP